MTEEFSLAGDNFQMIDDCLIEVRVAGCIFQMIDDCLLLEKIELEFLKEAKKYQGQKRVCKIMGEIAHEARLRIERIDRLLSGDKLQ